MAFVVNFDFEGMFLNIWVSTSALDGDGGEVVFEHFFTIFL